MNKKSLGLLLSPLVIILIAVGIYCWQSKNTRSRLPISDLTQQQEPSEATALEVTKESKFSSAEAKTIIEHRANEVIEAIKNKDMIKFSTFAHPILGVRFSPYSYVDTENNLVFTSSDLQNIFSRSQKYTWGSFDGTGFPIELTFDEYYKQFIYNQDYANADDVAYNKIIGHGNTLNNNFEVYPNAIIVEFHFPGFDPKYEGMDWSSLRLVFVKENNVWYIVGIIHDQWTI